ncbi:MAG: hypothetical protein LQ347_005947 [Umbilicaria vellea]|nr:MAG: hypothetical protein LQ347_005947 [Umbilicaria vellea]
MDLAPSSSDIQAALRYSLVATWSSISEGPPLSITNAAGEPFKPGASGQRDSAGLGKLIHGIHFSRRFILSFQLVILTVLLAYTVVHWGKKVLRWKKRQAAAKWSRDVTYSYKDGSNVPRMDESHGSSSSSSSTLEGTASPTQPLKVDPVQEERSPLLRSPHVKTRKASVLKILRAWMVYQPQPLSIINKTLPSNATTLAVLALIGIDIFYTLYKVPFTVPMLFVFADRAGLVFVANLPLLYLLAAKNQPVKLLTGYSYESLNIFHRRLGEVMCLLALLHGVGMLGVWYTLLRPAGLGLARFLLSKIILLGIGAFVAYEALYFTSLGSFRQRWYELFLGLHIVLQVAALILLWFHHSNSRVYVGVALAIFLIDRLVYRFTLKTKTTRASIELKEDKSTVTLHAGIPLVKGGSALRKVFGRDITNGWKATEHVFLTVPSLARKHIIQAHPFTIASRAPMPSDTEASLDLIIRAQDGFSSDLVRHANSQSTVSVRLDGPYGSQTAVDLLQESDFSIIVAGGSGIAVAWPLVWSALERHQEKDLEISAGARTTQRICLVWVVHERSHLSWISTEQMDELKARGVDTIIPEPTNEKGRPNVGHIVESWIIKRDGVYQGGQASFGVVCSGPDGMNRAVRNTCSSLLRSGYDVRVDIEKFGW